MWSYPLSLIEDSTQRRRGHRRLVPFAQVRRHQAGRGALDIGPRGGLRARPPPAVVRAGGACGRADPAFPAARGAGSRSAGRLPAAGPRPAAPPLWWSRADRSGPAPSRPQQQEGPVVNPSRRVLHLRRASLRTGLAAVGVALALAGCSATNPATIATPFPVGEGTNGQIGGEQVTEGDGSWSGNGGIKLRNFLVVSQGANAPGVVVGGISNDTGQPATVELQLAYTGSDGQQQSLGTTSVPVQAGQTVQLGNPAGLSGTASPSSTGAGGAQPAAGPSVWFQVPKV